MRQSTVGGYTVDGCAGRRLRQSAIAMSAIPMLAALLSAVPVGDCDFSDCDVSCAVVGCTVCVYAIGDPVVGSDKRKSGTRP